MKALRDNEVVCLLSDRDLTGDGIEVEFFGERTTLPGGPATLALRSGAPLVPVAVLLPDHGDSRVRHPRPARHHPAGAGSATTSPGSPRTSPTRFEDLIRVAPEHWHLLQPNWPSDRAGVG